MPIYEYRCTNCGQEFEEIMKLSDPAPRCPGCGSDKVERQMSTAAFRPDGVPSGSGGFEGPKCGSGG